MKNISLFAVGVGLAALTAPVSAATSVDTSACAGFTVSDNCRFNGNINTNTNGNASYLLAEDAYNAIFADDLILNPLGSSTVGAGMTSGNWTFAGFNVNYLAVKTATTFVLYKTSGSSGTWSTVGNGGNRNGQAQGLSHLVFFGSAAVAVPEPGTWALVILGFGAVGGALRRRAALQNAQRTRLTYA